jgi:hypothetical protein
MLTNPILQAKYEAQMRLDKKANHDIREYVANSRRTVLELARKYGLTIRYGQIKGGYLEPVLKEVAAMKNSPVQKIPELN